MLLVGLGRIGRGVAISLIRNGFRVDVIDVRPDAEAQALAIGARWLGTHPDAAAGASILLTVLPGSPELRSVMLGPDGLLAVLPPGVTWIDLTSAAPDLGAELAGAAAAGRIAYLDAPVGGGPVEAERGELTLYVGGDDTVMTTLQPMFAAIAQRVHHLGGPGSGYATKLLVNMQWFSQAIITGEALLLGQRVGIAPGRLRDVFESGPAANEFSRRYLPALLAGDYLTTFGLDRCVEELDSVQRLAEQHRTPFTVSAATVATYRAALAHFGAIDGELLGIGYLEHLAGSELRRPAP